MLCTRVNPDTIGCVWTGEFDLNSLHVDGQIFDSRKKKLRTQKYPSVTCGRDLKEGCSLNRKPREKNVSYLFYRRLQTRVFTTRKIHTNLHPGQD